jgi:S-adenosylmethionine hydrolase
MSRPVITLTTDFGYADAYIGAMKGVILGICPNSTLVDISHEIPPQAVRQAAYVLSAAAPYFPPKTVHLVVVDPGVGTSRRPIAVETQRPAYYVAPDNGVLSLAIASDPVQRAVHLTDPRFQRPEVSATFHGRDIFAPATAHLAAGLDLHELGEPIRPSDLTALPVPQPVQHANGTWLAEIMHIDYFGNLITNFVPPSSSIELSVTTDNTYLPGIARTFADVMPGELLAYIGSSGYLELAVREGNAHTTTGLGIGDSIQIEAQS